jgi:cytochrome c oxidase subunit 4
MTSNNHNAPAANGEAFDELDPHGFDKGHGHDHGHVIVGPFTLRTVLAFLLMFTVLTVFLAQAEVWAEGYFHIELPWWVNVVGAMSIAVVKALLVMAFFMQLRYDNPINTVLMCFTFAALATFLGFTGMDLFNRGAVDPLKASQVIPGGTGQGVNGPGGVPVGDNIVAAASNRMLDRLKERLGSEEKARERFEEMREVIHRAHGHVEAPEPIISTASMSRPKVGLTNALSATEAPAKDEPKGERKAEPEKHADAR